MWITLQSYNFVWRKTTKVVYFLFIWRVPVKFMCTVSQGNIKGLRQCPWPVWPRDLVGKWQEAELSGMLPAGLWQQSRSGASWVTMKWAEVAYLSLFSSLYTLIYVCELKVVCRHILEHSVFIYKG